MRFCYVRDQPPLIAENELSAYKLIQKFDNGAFSVTVVDEDENFIGTVTRETFCRDFPGKSFWVQRNLFLSAEDGETATRRKAAETFLETGIRGQCQEFCVIRIVDLTPFFQRKIFRVP